MRVLITGESGFIATNLAKTLTSLGHTPVLINDSNVLRLKSTGEVCVHRNSAEVWAWHISNLNVDVVIHNAALVGTDVVALSPHEATLTNVAGTYNIVRACNSTNTPVCYMGTTVIYDTAVYQEKVIVENSSLNPTTFYGIQKLAGENIVKTHSKEWMVIRPLFAFGGVGDMNSLIAKSLYSLREDRREIDMFLNPDKIKDYLHVTDYCSAVIKACQEGLWKDDFNIAAETPCHVSKIVDMISEITESDISERITWHPETDYLGNHMLSSEKFRKKTNWKPEISLAMGIEQSYKDIWNDVTGYNPLVHLDSAKNQAIDLTNFFNVDS
jgi:nucleoside-diphosphate-sugar epimerase